MTRAIIRRDIHIPFYWLIVGIATCLVSPILAIIVSVHVNNETIRKNEEARAAASAEAGVRLCGLLGAQADVYRDAVTDVGRAAYRVWSDEYAVRNCLPRR